jgi:hypothetical protein
VGQAKSAVVSATATINNNAKKNNKIKIPQVMIDNLKEFNTLCYQHTIDGTPLPTSVSSLSAAQSSMRRHNSSNAPQKAKCGIYLAKLICKQANHVIAYR